MVGDAETLSLADAGQIWLPGQTDVRREGLETMFGSQHEGLSQSMAQALNCMDPASLVGAPSTGYPAGTLGDNLRHLAALIKADVGVHVAATDHLGWDTHHFELNELDQRVPELADCLAAFHADLGSHADRTLVLVMTEFGRRVRDNMSGTDHGHGSVMFALGGGVNGGQVFLRDGTWPGLSEQDLYEGRDLQVTTDFRDVFGEVMLRFLGLGFTKTKEVLLGHSLTNSTMPGLFA
jgi:uncharacterized protein (DUF1501 family)